MALAASGLQPAQPAQPRQVVAMTPMTVAPAAPTAPTAPAPLLRSVSFSQQSQQPTQPAQLPQQVQRKVQPGIQRASTLNGGQLQPQPQAPVMRHAGIVYKPATAFHSGRQNSAPAPTVQGIQGIQTAPGVPAVPGVPAAPGVAGVPVVQPVQPVHAAWSRQATAPLPSSRPVYRHQSYSLSIPPGQIAQQPKPAQATNLASGLPVTKVGPTSESISESPTNQASTKPEPGSPVQDIADAGADQSPSSPTSTKPEPASSPAQDLGEEGGCCTSLQVYLHMSLCCLTC